MHIHEFLNSAVHGDEWSASYSGHLTPAEMTPGHNGDRGAYTLFHDLPRLKFRLVRETASFDLKTPRPLSSTFPFVVTTVVASTPMPLVCSASWGEGPDYNLVPTPQEHYLLK